MGREQTQALIDAKATTPSMDPGASVAKELRVLVAEMTQPEPTLRPGSMARIRDRLFSQLGAELSPFLIAGDQELVDADSPMALARAVVARALEVGTSMGSEDSHGGLER